MATKRIGWIGLGNMGMPMVKNLLKAGFEVSVYNRTVGKAAALVELGASVAGSPGELWEKADTVITMVADDNALRQVHEGPDGLLAGAGAGGRVVIDMSTVSPATTKELAAKLAARGVDYLDAPVSGSVKPAELGQLVIMVGGKKAVYEAAAPIFEKLGKASFHLGEQGSGNNAKLAINLFLSFTMQGLAEAVNFAREKGVAPAEMMAVINESAVGSAFAKLKTPNFVNDQYPAAFALKLMAKDLRLVKEQGMHSPGGLVVEESFRQAAAEGLGEEDLSAIIKFIATKGL
ncbi:MAG TPA: NAD(P)-dependent oxidoreductase [Puia sp.]|nr:NAD(P)-dependent oxidoreductase [Puia sp.]